MKIEVFWKKIPKIFVIDLCLWRGENPNFYVEKRGIACVFLEERRERTRVCPMFDKSLMALLRCTQTLPLKMKHRDQPCQA